ncbi:hypothetical protein [Chryseobacterium oryctis]|uniref:SprB repeat-containing protein n=1 Tax=Chryseobacterium oryctis TaxID=2952618 RepID=A0ABT3HNY3_9FLAO|nr:hypothetical protein [Chryseobacterium oryctis]MCW3161323.1 hypothetical protein [Chryseobacterium oryctis]
MRWVFTTLLLLLAVGLNAQFTITATTTPEFCAGTGAAAFTVNNTVPGATVDFLLYKLPDTTTPYRTASEDATATTTSHTESNLPQGNYRLQVVHSLGGVPTNLTPYNFSIGNNFTAITAQNISITPTTVCGDKATFVVNVAGSGQPARYELRNLSNSVIFPFQTSPNFTSPIAAGTYRLAVEDICGNTTVKDVNVVVSTSIVRPNTSIQLSLTSCNTISYKQGVTATQNNASSPSYIKVFQYPVQLNVEVKNAVTGVVVLQSNMMITNSAEASAGIPITITNFNPGDQLTHTATTTDACGVTATYTRTINYNPNFNFSSSFGECNARYLRILNFSDYFIDAETTVEFISYPAGFKPWEYNPDFVNGAYSHTYNTLPEAYTGGSEIAFGGQYQPVPAGSYTIKVTNECGASVTKIYTFTQPAPQSPSAYNDPDCEEGWHNIGFYYDNGNTIGIAQAIITQAPQEFIDTYGPLPFDASAYIVTNPSTGKKELRMRVPTGIYTFQVTNTCGQEFTRNIDATKKVEVLSHNVTYTRFCGGYFTLNVSATVSGIGASNNVNYYLQKWYPAQNTWGHPTTGVTGDVANANTRQEYNSSTQYYAHGDLRVIAIPRLSKFGGTAMACPARYLVVEEFNIPDGAIKLNDYYTTSCPNGTFNLLLDATGIGTLTYKIIEKDGQSFIIDNGTDPVFTNLAEGSYKVEITDSQCLDVITVTLRVITTKMPIIRASNLCEGENGKLYVSGASYLTVEWYKNGVSTGVFGHSFPFTPYTSATDIGLYEAHLTYNPNPNSCINNVLSFNLTAGMENTPNAGTGQSVTIQQNTLTGPINLFDYLTPPYDAHGYWTDENNTGLLMGNNWYGQFANGGTYEFKYIVDGTCTNSAEATVTIKLEGYCLNDPASPGIGGTDTKVGITLLKRAGADDADNWPMVRKSGHIALESNTKGFVVTRIAKANLGNITKPQEGMMVYDTTDKCLKIYSDGAWRCFNEPTCP